MCWWSIFLSALCLNVFFCYVMSEWYNTTTTRITWSIIREQLTRPHKVGRFTWVIQHHSATSRKERPRKKREIIASKIIIIENNGNQNEWDFICMLSVLGCYYCHSSKREFILIVSFGFAFKNRVFSPPQLNNDHRWALFASKLHLKPQMQMVDLK